MMKLKKTSVAVAVAMLCGAPLGAHAATPAPTSGALEIWWKAPLKGSTVSGVLNDTKCYVNGRGVTKVDFYLGATLLNTDTTMSDGMSCSLDTTKFANGAHTLTAVASDSAGRTYRESASINIRNASAPAAPATQAPAPSAPAVSLPAPTSSSTPEIWFKSPARGATVSGMLDLGKCYVAGRGVSRVEFFLDNTRLNTDSTMADGMSCALDTSKFANGAHTLKAVAYNSSGRSYTETISINVQNAASAPAPTPTAPSAPAPTAPAPSAPAPTPTVTLPAPTSSSTPEVWFKSPVRGATVSGLLDLGKCYVAGRGVSRVEFFLDATRLNTDSTMADGMSCAVDTTKFANGTHTLKAVAYNSSGRSYTETISINVQNAVTAPAPTAPTTPTTPPPTTTPTVTLPAPTSSSTPEVWFKNPAKGATVSGLLQRDKCYVAGRGVTRVEFFLGNTALNIDSIVSDGMSCVLDTTKVANGTHTLKAVAYGSNGRTYVEPITVNVQNAATAPAPAPTQPAPAPAQPAPAPVQPAPSSPATSNPTPPAPASLPSTNTKAVATFESMGLYWKPPSTPAGAKCDVRFRPAGETSWRQGYPMWFDSRNGECRGSIVHLKPDTWYEVQFAMPGQSPVAQVNAKTWSENFPIAQVVHVTDRDTPLVITQGGSANGYVLYTPAPGSSATIDVKKAHNYNIRISAPYVIIRGLTLKNSAMDGIKIEEGAHDLVIEDNDISEWSSWGGHTSADGWKVARNKDSAIKAYCSSGPWLERTVIQRNKMHHPTYGANSWSGFKSGPSDPHPLGANGIYMLDCGPQHVWRYNDLYSSTGRYFMDGFGGGENFSTKGFPHADADIYGNRISHAWDDAIEAEGANRNVRIWGNYFDRTTTGVATTSTSVGPVYVFRNVHNRSHHKSMASHDSDNPLYMFKSGSQSGYGDGRRYMFHNTILQAPPPPGATSTSGPGEGLSGPNSRQIITNTVSRNNVYHVRRAGSPSINTQGGGNNDLDHDLVNGNVSAYSGAEAHRIVGIPLYAPGNGWISEGNGMYQLAPHSPGYDKGVVLPNFNDGFTGAAPDMGAHEAGTPAMRLGVSAGGAGGVWSGPLGSGTSFGSGSSTGGTSTSGNTSTSGTGVCSTAICVATQ